MKRKGKIEIDGFWIFVILFFVFVPLGEKVLKTITEVSKLKHTRSYNSRQEEPRSVSEEPKAVQEIFIADSEGQAPVGRDIKLLISEKAQKEIWRCTGLSPSRVSTELLIQKEYIYCKFDEVGIWEISMVDKYGMSVGKYKILVE